MKSIDFIRRVQRSGNPIITTTQAARIMNKDRAYASLFLARLCNKGELEALERGKYYVPGTNAYQIASNVIRPSYISMLSALKYHNITTQNPVQIDVISTVRHSPIKEVGGYRIRFIKFGMDRFFGFYRDRESGIFIAYIEKAIVDSLYMKNVPLAYVEEAIEIAKKSGKLDSIKLDVFSERMHSAALKKNMRRIFSTLGKIDRHEALR